MDAVNFELLRQLSYTSIQLWGLFWFLIEPELLLLIMIEHKRHTHTQYIYIITNIFIDLINVFDKS